MRNRVGAIIIQNKRILLVSTDGSWYWTPGGKIEVGEDAQSTLSRELKEELSIVPDEIRLYNKYAVQPGEEVAGYVVQGGDEINYIVSVSGDIKPSAEVKIANWYTGAEAMGLTMLESFKSEVLKQLLVDGLL